MEIKVRAIGLYNDVTIITNDTTINVGLLDHNESESLAKDLVWAIYELIRGDESRLQEMVSEV